MPTTIEESVEGSTMGTGTEGIRTIPDDILMGHYVLVIIGIKASTIKKLDEEDITSINVLGHVTKDTLNELRMDGIISRGNRDAIIRFQSWYRNYLIENEVPNMEELRRVFTKESFDGYYDDSIYV